MKKEILELKDFEGHIVLYCKNKYDVKGVDFLTGLRRIWAVRCGIEIEKFDKSCDEYIANALYKTFAKLYPNKVNHIYEFIHRELSDRFKIHYIDLNPIERLIMLYRSDIMFSTIREKRGERFFTLVKLPKPKKRLFKRIVAGKGKYSDYNLVK